MRMPVRVELAVSSNISSITCRFSTDSACNTPSHRTAMLDQTRQKLRLTDELADAMADRVWPPHQNDRQTVTRRSSHGDDAG
jgi:hypothetical protein